jgi:hypothetical protein
MNRETTNSQQRKPGFASRPPPDGAGRYGALVVVDGDFESWGRRLQVESLAANSSFAAPTTARAVSTT